MLAENSLARLFPRRVYKLGRLGHASDATTDVP